MALSQVVVCSSMLLRSPSHRMYVQSAGDWVELQFCWTRHPRAILKDESDAVITQEIRQFSIEPDSIANLDC